MSGVPSQPLPPAPTGPLAPTAGAGPVAVPVADGTAVAVPAKLQGLTRAVAVPGTVAGTGDNGLTIVRTGAGDLTLRLSDPPPTDRPVTVQLTPGQPMRATVLATSQPAPQPGSTAATILTNAQPATTDAPPPEARPPDSVGSAVKPVAPTPLPPTTLPPTQPGAVVPAQVVAATPLASLIAGAAGLALPGSTPSIRPQSLSTPGVLARLVERLFAEYDQVYGPPSEPEAAPDAPSGKTEAPAKGTTPRTAPSTPGETAITAPTGQNAPAEPTTETEAPPAAASPKAPTENVRPAPAEVRPTPTPAPPPVPGPVTEAPQPDKPEASGRTPQPPSPSPKAAVGNTASAVTEQPELPASTATSDRAQPRPVADAKPSLPAAPTTAPNTVVAPNVAHDAVRPPARPESAAAPLPTVPESVPESGPATEAPPPSVPTTKTEATPHRESPAARPPPLLTQGGTVGLRIVSVTPPDTPATEAPPPPQPSPDGEPQITGIVGGTTQRGQPVLVTASGSLILNTRTPLEKGTVVTAALLPEFAPLPIDPTVPDPVKLMTSGADLPETRAMLAALSSVDRGLAAQVAASLLPQPSRKLGAALTFLLGAMRGGDARGWLGDEATGALGKAGLSDVVSRFEREFRASDRESTDSTQTEWRSYTLPMLDSTGLTPIRLHVQAVGEEERKKRERGESEGRSHFLVDVSLSRLGPLQLDGLIRAKRFDLVLRSHAPLPEGLRGELARVFTDSVTAVGYTGGISFQAGGRSWVVPAPRADAGKGVTA